MYLCVGGGVGFGTSEAGIVDGDGPHKDGAKVVFTCTSDCDAFSTNVAVDISAGIWYRKNCASLYKRNELSLRMV